ncbi:MAG: transglutaminase-like domain-containing protein [Proteobacteria bacterium]|nr:transglutaminase-like domain-containing protein [Pseudomonadota bacterium]
MMSPSTLCLTLFLSVLCWHLGLSMEIPAVTFAGIGLSFLAGIRVLKVERPTWGLVFVLLTSGAFMGNQVLEDWALEGSWPQENGLGAGLILSLLLYLIWIFAAHSDAESDAGDTAIDRDTQSILVTGLLLLVMMEAPESSIVEIMGERLGLFIAAGILLACAALVADRSRGFLLQRILLLAPLALTVPVMNAALELGQRPVIAAIGNIMPSPRSFSASGFSPNQQLNASNFVRPSSRAVLRIHSEQNPGRYLVGNRLTALDEDYIWRGTEDAVQVVTNFDAELTPEGEWRYALENNQYAAQPAASYQVNYLGSDSYLFLAPGATHVRGTFGSMRKDGANVWTASYDRGADRRWQVEMGGQPEPDEFDEALLRLPRFWDESLQAKSEGFASDRRITTVDNIVNHFVTRRYSLQVDFDPEQPFHDFYLNDREGYCFWFATATTLALRANGIPSRLVSGYAINEQLSPELWLVRDRDAHSWVEWQDEAGYWHTIDPTPPSIESFFGGYQSSTASRWYHYLAGQWQLMIDRILEDEVMANLIRWGGLAILLFLFMREYRRIQGERRRLDSRARRWQRLWQRFLHKTNLPVQASWTAETYASNLPESWPQEWRAAAVQFLLRYSDSRFAPHDESTLQEVERSLDACLRAFSSVPVTPTAQG